MSHRESPLYWSIPCGTWYDTRVRISVFFVVLAGVICYRLGLRLGLLFDAVLLASVLLHEFGHIVAARLTHGGGNDVFIWPFGGIAAVQTAGTFQSRLLTPAAGPLVNAALCAATAWPVFHSGETIALLNPLAFPLAELTANPLLDICLLMFWTNWILLCINLLPVFPLDGGRMLQSVLSARWGGEAAVDIYIRIGFIVGILVIVGSLLIKSDDGKTDANMWVMLIGTMVLILNLQESVQLRTTDGYDESFMGYDFSQGYTSLEQAEGTRSVPRRAGLYRRWKEKRKAEKSRRRDEKDAEVAQQLDMLLEKVHTNGIESLTDAERRQLDRASAHIRAKDQQKQ